MNKVLERFIMEKITLIFDENEIRKIKIYLTEILLQSQRKDDFREQMCVSKILSKIQAFQDICDSKE